LNWLLKKPFPGLACYYSPHPNPLPSERGEGVRGTVLSLSPAIGGGEGRVRGQKGHSLGTRVIAKGVENQRQFRQLMAQHCDEAQGFYLGKPMPAARFEEHLRRHGARFGSSMAP